VSDDGEAHAILARWRGGAISDEIALMQLLLRFEDVARVRAAVADAPALAALLDAHEAGCARICAMLQSGVDAGGGVAASVVEGLAATRRLFDWSVEQDEAASVALYSLGSPAILERATAEIVALLEGWGVLAPTARVLELGCGIGRLAVPIAARVAHVVGIDVAPRMIEAATRRAGALANVELRTVSGRDLADFGDASFDLVLAADSFPYVVQAGAALVATMFAEARRVLVPGGCFALLGYSYEQGPDADRADVAAAARAHDLELVVDGARPFALWDASAFLLRRPAAGAAQPPEPTPSSRR
jgi:SAM-dependent methyltransferase